MGIIDSCQDTTKSFVSDKQYFRLQMDVDESGFYFDLKKIDSLENESAIKIQLKVKKWLSKKNSKI